MSLVQSMHAASGRADVTGGLYELPNLPYAMEALEPHLSRETLEYHYGKHHRGYIAKLNSLVLGSRLEGLPLDQLVRKASGALYQTAAQAWNHDFYWRCMTPQSRWDATSPLAAAIEGQFGALAAFKEQFTQQATTKFGSGWTWLVRTKEGLLAIQNTDDADNPLRRGRKPLMVCDVWEHAYYIDYRNDRARYVDAFWQVVNWEFAARNYLPGSVATGGAES
jgi:Fe-Mn family superoxide dismutase